MVAEIKQDPAIVLVNFSAVNPRLSVFIRGSIPR
jgi:hypothetical protein